MPSRFPQAAQAALPARWLYLSLLLTASLCTQICMSHCTDLAALITLHFRAFGCVSPDRPCVSRFRMAASGWALGPQFLLIASLCKHDSVQLSDCRPCGL